MSGNGAAVAPKKGAPMDTRNMVVLVGRLAADPVLRYLPNGTPVSNFAVAVNRRVPKAGGGFDDNLDGFFDCELFGGLGLAAAESLSKGTEVQLAGSLLQKKFKGNGGHTVSKVEIRVRSIASVLTPAKDETAVTQAAAPASEPA